jgi:hypothetical protein
MAMAALKRLIKQVPADRKPIADSLFKELTFMEKTLTELKKAIKTEGPVSMFKQGQQQFLRENPALKSYNTTVQRYSLLYKQLTDLLPPSVQPEAFDPLTDFIKKV